MLMLHRHITLPCVAKSHESTGLVCREEDREENALELDFLALIVMSHGMSVPGLLLVPMEETQVVLV